VRQQGMKKTACALLISSLKGGNPYITNGRFFLVCLTYRQALPQLNGIFDLFLNIENSHKGCFFVGYFTER
jgi:hypothetical protein